MHKVAAIDIGSNAIRFQVTNILTFDGQTEFKRIEYIRFPLRLGHDVFTIGRISESNKSKFIKLMHSYKLLLELYEIEDYYAGATSAIRESENGYIIAREVEDSLGLKINIIGGDLEGELINKAIKPFITNEPHLHIDVGGGSTELSVLHNRVRISSESFSLGSVRRLEKKDEPAVWDEMQSWIWEKVHKRFKSITCIGTGGNINKIYDMSGKRISKSISRIKIKEISDLISGYSQLERINILKLNPDRADVIIPASEIYLAVMKYAGAGRIIVPDVGLKDGMVYSVFERLKAENRLVTS